LESVAGFQQSTKFDVRRATETPATRVEVRLKAIV